MESKKYGAFWLPQSTSIASDLPPPKHLFPSNLHLKSCAVGIKKGICLVEDGKVYEKRFTKEESKGQIKEIFIQNTIKNISCSDMMGMMINLQGEVFLWGEDSSQGGLFVEPGLFLSENPIKIPRLSDIIQGSLGKTHAAVIDSLGHLFTWGTGSQGELGTLGFSISNQPPQIVESAKIFKAKQVICGPSFTCICTDGCYVYLYGIIGSAHNYTNSRRSSVVRRLSTSSPKKGAGNYPYTLPELEKYSTIFVCCGNNYIATLTDSGEAYIFDDCMDLVKLPVNYGNNINFISSTLEVVYGYSRASNCLYEWREKVQSMLSTNSDYCDCQLAYWIGRVYSIDNEYSKRINLVSTSSHMAGILYEAEAPGYNRIATFVDEISPYKRSESSTKLIGSVFDSIDYKMEKNLSLRSSLRSSLDLTGIDGHEDLERLYPKGYNDKTIVKIIQCRNEYERKEKLAKSISFIVNSIIKTGFLKIKEFASVKKMYEKTLSAALMSGVIGKFYHKYRIGSESYAFQMIKRFANLKWKKDSNYDPRKIEGSREIWHEISTLCYKQKLMAFTLIKGREIFCLQRKTALLTLKQLIKDMNRKAIKLAFDKWSSTIPFDENKFLIYKLVNVVSQIRTRNLNIGLKNLMLSAKDNDNDQKTIEKVLKKCILLYERAFYKQTIKIWKKNTDFDKMNEFNLDYQKRLNAKIIFNRISSNRKKLKSKVFKIIYDYSIEIYNKAQEEISINLAQTAKLNSDFEQMKIEKNIIMKEKLQTLENILQIIQLNVLSDAWSSFMEDGKKRAYSIISLPNTTDATSNNTPEILKQDEEMVNMPPIDIFPVRHRNVPSLSSNTLNFLSIFPNLHVKLSEKDNQKLEFIPPAYTDKFILDLPSEQRSHPMDLEDSEVLRTPNTTPTKFKLFSITQPIYKTPEVEHQNETSRSNLFADHSSQRSFDNSDYQKKLIQNIISKPKIHKEKEVEKEKDKALQVALNSGRPPWKPSSKSAVIEEKKKPLLINPTKKMQQYDYGLKERLKFIQKQKARIQTPNSERQNNNSPFQSLLTLPDSVPSESELFLPRNEKINIFNSDFSFGKQFGDDKRRRISYKKLIKYRKGIPIFEQTLMKVLSKVKSEALLKIKLTPKITGKPKNIRGPENKKKQISWQKRLYILASDSLKKSLRKIFAKRFVAKLIKYRR